MKIMLSVVVTIGHVKMMGPGVGLVLLVKVSSAVIKLLIMCSYAQLKLHYHRGTLKVYNWTLN